MAATFDDLERVYERLATAIDEAGAEKADVFLTKLALRLANEIGTAAPVLAAIEDCLKDL